MTALTIAGAHVVCYVNGKLYGRITNFSWSSQTANRPIYVLDTVDPVELAPGQTKISASMNVIRLHGDGGLQGTGMVPNYEQIPNGKYFTFTLIDRLTDLTIFNANYCKIQDESWSVPSKGLVTGSVRFEALEWSNSDARI
jgi:hypothetical protein